MSLKMRDGFTLAEVLITLAIIGVVAALTTPSVIRNSQNAKIGPTLAKICTTMETAIQAACNDQEKLYFKDVVNPSDPANLNLINKIELLSEKYMRARLYTGDLPGSIVGLDGSSYAPDNGAIYMFSDKSAVIVPASCELGGGTDKCEIHALIAGFQSRTRLVLGQDIFPLMVTKEGYVLPPGMSEQMDVSDKCTDDQINSRSIDGYYCGDRIANNGWKADWK